MFKWANISNFLYRPNSTLSISVLRITFGFFVMWQAYNKGIRIFTGTAMDGFEFKYPFFGWVHGSPEYAGILAVAWFVAGLLFAAGFLFRVTGPFCFFITLYSYLIAADRYLNHEYMELIFLLLLSLSPAHYRLSVDSYIWKLPKLAPNYHLFALKVQTEIILVYAGLVKINYDWLHLQPLSNWLAAKSELVFFGSVWLHSWGVAIGAYGIIVLHILGAPLMFWKKTRLPVFLVYSAFHIINSQIFPIDIFPWMTIACSTLFFNADWPAQMLVAAKRVFKIRQVSIDGHPATTVMRSSYRVSFLDMSMSGIFLIWLVTQILLPIRCLFYLGNVDWTGEGSRFSWRMMLESRSCPVLNFVLIDPNTQKLIFADLKAMMPQKKQLLFVCREPDQVLQTAVRLKEIYTKEALLSDSTEVHAYILRSLNYRKPSLYVDPKRDLAKESIMSLGYTWLNRAIELEPLPAPGVSEIKNFQKPNPSAVALAMGIDIDHGYICGYGASPLNTGGTDIICNAKN